MQKDFKYIFKNKDFFQIDTSKHPTRIRVNFGNIWEKERQIAKLIINNYPIFQSDIKKHFQNIDKDLQIELKRFPNFKLNLFDKEFLQNLLEIQNGHLVRL